MAAGWSPDDLRCIDVARELQIAVRRCDGGLGRSVPIWVVTADEQTYVRSWSRRDTGWFGRALRSRRARVRVPGLQADVSVVDLGDTSVHVTARVDLAYVIKYGRGGADSMVTDAAAATTLRLDPE